MLVAGPKTRSLEVVQSGFEEAYTRIHTRVCTQHDIHDARVDKQWTHIPDHTGLPSTHLCTCTSVHKPSCPE